MRTALEIRADWLARLLSIEPADHSRAESALRDLYAAAGFQPPQAFFWFDSPSAAAWAVAVLTGPHDFIWQRMIEALGRRRRERENIDRVRAALCRSAAQADWKSLLAVAGEPLSGAPVRLGNAPAGPVKSIQSSVTVARLQLYENVADAISRFDDSDGLHRAEHGLRGVISGQAGWSLINPLMAASFCVQYSFSMMALDEAAAGERAAPPILAAAWDAARSTGLWWPFSRSVVVSERPIEMHLNEKSLLHRADGPAAVYRDGVSVWAWNGHAMRESWIVHPEDIPARDLKEFDPAFREYAAARAGASKPKARLKSSSILRRELSAGAEDRVALLREYNQGRLPFFDRYIAGEHGEVWQELIALGPAVREDPYAAGALAVAYETMGRVGANVRHVTARLQALGYRGASAQAHKPPDPKTHKQIARLEKAAGALPLSLRAFYEVVGAVNWMGEHPSLAPRDDSVAPDPLVVFPVEDALAQAKEGFEDNEAIVVAPDDLHKSNTSGGDPYEIAVPELGADGKLLNERHELYFVDYLRLVFRFGGFPGYDGVDSAVPGELATLRDGLTPF